MKNFIAFIALAVAITGCSRTVQTTSGQEYLSQYTHIAPAPSYRTLSKDDGVVEVKSIDQRVREAAAVEPVLKFPARIGLARVDNGSLTVIPSAEADAWNAAATKLGRSFGEFVPVNPMVAKMVASEGSGRYDQRVNSVIDVIRLGAARQHLDAVLVYELISKESTHANILAAANTTILGAYILPSARNDAEGIGNALLIDVMQAYPYGTLNTVVEKKSKMSSAWGWGSKPDDKRALGEAVKTQAAVQLAEESYDLFRDLRVQLAERGPIPLR